MLSDDTIKRIQILMDKAAEITKKFPGMNQTEALLCANSTMTVEEIMALKARAERMEERQEEIVSAAMRANSAYVSTFRAHVEKK